MRALSKKEIAGFFVILAGAGVAGSPRSEEPPRSHEIAIAEMEFGAAPADVRPGDTVVWVNRDPVPHTVTGADGTFDSGELAEGERFRFVVGADGEIRYRCRYHPLMDGVLEVTR